MTLPALRSLYDEDQLWHGVCHPRVRDLYEATGYFDRLTPLEGPPWNLWRALRAWRPDRAVVFTSPVSGRILARLSGAPLRLGRGGPGFTSALPRDTREQRFWRSQAELAEAAGGGTVGRPNFLLDPGEKAHRRASELLSGATGRRLVIAPGAAYGPAKTWPLESFGEVATWARDAGWTTVVLGGRQEGALAERIQADLDLTGETTLLEAVAVMTQSRIGLSNDSGAMHLARAAGLPVVAVFGSTSPDWTGPESHEGTALYEGVSCSPCFLRTCRWKDDRTMQCMHAVSPARVIEQILVLDERL